MKKILWVIVIAAALFWGWPAITLSESGAMRFLDELDRLSLQGKPDEYCAMLHEEMTVHVTDATSRQGTMRIEGGKKEWCDYVGYAAKGLDLLGVQTQVTRENVSVSRRLLHPWAADVTYDERRTSTMSKLNVTLHTQSHDRWTLVQTWSGVQARSLDSDTRIAP